MRAIDADALRRRIADFCHDCGCKDDECHKCYVDDVYLFIQEAPTLDVMPVVHGQWTEEEVWASELAKIDAWQSAKCSVCGKYHTTPYMYYFDDYNFCPHCGAKMDGERKEE